MAFWAFGGGWTDKGGKMFDLPNRSLGIVPLSMHSQGSVGGRSAQAKDGATSRGQEGSAAEVALLGEGC